MAILDSPSVPTKRRATPAPLASRRRDTASVVLDVVVIFSLVTAALRLVELPFLSGMISTAEVVARTAGYALGLVAAVVLWLRWRRLTRQGAGRGRPGALAIAFTAITASLFFIGDQALPLPLFVVGLIMLLRSYRVRAGVIAVGVLVLAQGVLFVIIGRDWPTIAQQLISSSFLFGFGLLIAWLFAEVDRQRRDNAALATEVSRRAGMDAEVASLRERQRTARDLHDGIGHEVTVIMMSLQFAERMRHRDHDRAWAEVSRAREQAARALEDIRRLARALHPSGLDEGGSADLSALAASFRGTGLAVVVTDDAQGVALGDDLAVFRRRFVQEALTNVVRHSSATQVTVRQQVVDDRIVITVTDDGGPSEVLEPGFGLRSLQERAEQLGGTTTVRQHPSGLEVAASVPLGVHS